MNILIFDTNDAELQRQCLEAGNTVYLYFTQMGNRYDRYTNKLIRDDVLDNDGLAEEYPGRLLEMPFQWDSKEGLEFIAREIGMVIQPAPLPYDIYTKLAPYTYVIGQSDKVMRLEDDRIYANEVFESIGGQAHPSHAMSVEKAKHFILDNDDFRWVIKAGVGNYDDTMRTIVTGNDVQTLYYLDTLPDNMSVVVQKYTSDPMISITAIFDGVHFLRNKNDKSRVLAITDIEQKGALNSDRGFVVTGQVGTVMTVVSLSDKINDLFIKLEPMLEDEMRGFFDIHFSVDSEGNPSLIEFTPRFGVPTMQGFMSLLTEDTDLPNFLYDLQYSGTNVFVDHESVVVGGCVYGYGVGIDDFEGLNSMATGFSRLSDYVDFALIDCLFLLDGDLGGIDADAYLFNNRQRIGMLSVSSGKMVKEIILQDKKPLDACIDELYANLKRVSGFGLMYRDDYGKIDPRIRTLSILDEKSKRKLATDKTTLYEGDYNG